MASQYHGIHSCEECVPEGSDYFQQTPRRRRSSTLIQRRQYRSNWRSSSHHRKKIPQAMRNMKDSILEEPLIRIELLDKKWWSHEWIRWWSGRIKKESTTHETNKDKYSIVISWYCFIMQLFIFSWCIMHDRMFALLILYY